MCGWGQPFFPIDRLSSIFIKSFLSNDDNDLFVSETGNVRRVFALAS